MRHLVLSIAAIALIQLAFQVSIVDDQEAKYAASIAAGSWPADTIVTARGDLHTVPVKAERPSLHRVKYRRLAERRSEPSRAAYRPAVPRAQTRLSAKTSPQKTPDKVLRPDGPGDDDGDGKPWIAKALPIVKKPYDWLKALGAKLK